MSLTDFPVSVPDVTITVTPPFERVMEYDSTAFGAVVVFVSDIGLPSSVGGF